MNGLQNSESAALAIMDVTPFCQIVGREISASQCVEMQGEQGCFGCGASTRLCEDCKVVPVDVPAVGLCSGCLIKHLEHENHYGKALLLNLSIIVTCQLVRREIGSEMCFATQGQEGCRNCGAVSRLCEKCKQNPCRFPQYGLCYHCTIEEFGEGWDPAKAVVSLAFARTPAGDPSVDAAPVARLPIMESEDSQGKLKSRRIRKARLRRKREQKGSLQIAFPHGVGIPTERKFRRFLTKRRTVSANATSKAFNIARRVAASILHWCEDQGWVSLPPKVTSSRDVLIFDGPSPLLNVPADKLCARCAVAPIYVRKLGLCKGCSTKKYELDKRIPRLIERYMPKVRQLVRQSLKVSAIYFSRKLNVNLEKANLILSQCEKEGLVGPARGPAPRAVLKPLMCSKCGENPVRVWKRGLCKTCAVGFYRKRSDLRDGRIMTTLRAETTIHEVSQSQSPLQMIVEAIPAEQLFPIRQKIAKLKELASTLGEGDMSNILNSIVVDLQGWEMVKAVVDRVRTEPKPRG